MNYATSVEPGGLELGERKPMTGLREDRVTYPEFYLLPNGDLLLVYRDGSSGGGDVLMNRFDLQSRTWAPFNHPLIDGEGERNAYVNQLAFDAQSGWHVSWTWRTTPDVATNHDVMYAFSPDEGRTWLRSDGGSYELPINAATAEVVVAIPQNSDLINQTSMTVDATGRPAVVTYALRFGRPRHEADPFLPAPDHGR